MADEPIDLAKRRKRRDQARAGYVRAMTAYAEPSEAGLNAIVDEVEAAGGSGPGIVLLYGPAEINGVSISGWRLTPDEADRIADELKAKAAELRMRHG